MRLLLLRLVLLTGAGLALGLAGCGSGIRRIPETGATLEGTITYGKEKVLVAMVIVAGEGGVQGFVGDDGRYKVENVPLGEVKLGVNVDAAQGQLKGKMMAGQKVPKAIAVPVKYGDPETSGITTIISKGVNTYDIVIPK